MTWSTLLLTLLLVLQLGASSAYAHASLLETQPSDGAVLNQAPAIVVLRFNEPVAPLVFKLVFPNASILVLKQVISTADGIKLSLPHSIAHGSYLLSWRVVSADGHPVGGTIAYAVGAESTHTAAILPTRSGWLSWLIWLTRFGLYGALFIGIGASLFRAFIQQPIAPVARWRSMPLWIGLALLPLALGAQGLDALGSTWRTLTTLQPWQAALGTAYGNTLLLMLAAISLAWVANRSSTMVARRLALLSALLLGSAFAVSGHASSAPPVWLARPVVFIHTTMVVLWIGSLLPLLLLLRQTSDSSGLVRFSKTIPWVLAPLLLSGVVLALLQLDRWAALWQTDYGRILSAKLIVVLMLLVLAATNRYRLTAAVQRGEPPARRKLTRMIEVEGVLVLIVLALVTTWRFTAPPRALAAVSMVPIKLHIHDARAMLDLSLIPQPGHRFRTTLYLQGSDFQPLQAKEVTVEFSNPTLGIQTIEKTAQQQAPGAWTVAPFVLPAPGRWLVKVGVLVSDFERIELEREVKLTF
ncbi:MAG: CopD family protein [Herbaspirillum sp.]